MPDKITIQLSTMLKRVQGYAEKDALSVGTSYALQLHARGRPKGAARILRSMADRIEREANIKDRVDSESPRA